jgi:uncharacterized protein (DUF885 family)
MTVRRAIAAALVALAATAALAAEPPRDKSLHALFDREFQRFLAEFPERATQLGIEGFDDRLTDHSPEAVARRRAQTSKVVAELQGFDPARLSVQDRISRDVMLANLALDAEENAIYGSLPFSTTTTFTPVSSTGGPHSTLVGVAKATRFRTVADYENYLKRLDAVPRAIGQHIATMRAGMRSGWMPPAEAMTRAVPMFAVFAAPEVKGTPLWRPFEQFPRDVPEAERARLAQAGERALAERVHPAFAELKRFMEAEYLPATRKSLGATALPGGDRFYDVRVRKMTTTRMKADEIHRLGLAEVARIRAEMDRVIASTGFKGTFGEFVHFINTDPRFFFKTASERLAAYRDIAKRADAELPKLFAELPRTPYGVRPMEAYEGDNADNYSRPAIDGSRAGFFNANANNLQDRPSYEMEAVLLHETVPGHHLQIARQQELQGLPLFRRSGGYVAYSEGWGLYAESLGYEMGFYKDPYMRFGALWAEAMRACRLVIDTGIHTKGWGREQSIKYMMDNAGLKLGFATSEIDRYINTPAQALGYKIGELRIKAMRAKAKAALGEGFDVRAFHNAVLDDGALPLTVLEARIDEWIRSRASAAPGKKAATAAAPQPARNTALHALFEREFTNALDEFPEFGTYLGMEGYDHRVADRSPAAVARRKARVARVIAELQRFDPAKLSAQDRVSRDVLLADLELQQAEYALYGKLPFGPAADSWSPVSSMRGPALDFPFIVKATRFRTAADYDNYLKRLRAWPRFLDQLVAAMRIGMASGWMPPKAAIQQVPGMYAVFAGSDVKASPLWRPFEEFPAAVAEAERRRLTDDGAKVLAAEVHPAFARLQRFLESEYLPAARTELAAAKLPAGRPYYDYLVRLQTTTAMGADEIHSTGLAEVARIRGEMDRVIAATGFQGDFKAFLKFLETDPRFYFTKAEDRLRAYRDIAKRADAELPKLFAQLPRMPYGIRAMEEYEGDNSDHYSGPALDGSRAGFFSANVNKLQNRPAYEMETTLLHEAVPGHHLQIARAMELADLPKFRRAGGYTAYVEGWALYAETLGFEMGFFKDPYQHFGRLQGEMLRAVRLVIDTGIHAKGWTRERAIAYFVDNGAGNLDYATAEVDRYIVLPGQALGYKVGELKIKALRDKARAALGAKFDLRRFHNAILDDGALPLTVLEERIDQWIGENK